MQPIENLLQAIVKKVKEEEKEKEEEEEKAIGEIAKKYLKTPPQDRDTTFGIIKKEKIIILGKHMLLLKIMTLLWLMMVQH